MAKQKLKCPNCGSNQLTVVGLQWFPLSVIDKQDWHPHCRDIARDRGSIRMFRCDVCGDSFIEPSLQ